MTNSQIDDSVKDFYRDLLMKMMGFGLAVLLLVSGWMIGTGDTEKFDWFKSEQDLINKSEEIALIYADKTERKYEIKQFEMETALRMRWDRAKGFIILAIGSIVWVIAVCIVKAKAGERATVFSWWLVVPYCVIMNLPYFYIGFLILND